MSEKISGNILIISHQERILNVADRIVVLADGKVTGSGTPEEIMPGLVGVSACGTLARKVVQA